MTQDLKTKIAEAIRGPILESDEVAEHMHLRAADEAAQAALQTIHDAGYDLTPREGSEPRAKVTARAARLVHAQAEVNREGEFLIERIDDLDWSDFEQLTREWTGHVEPSLARFRSAVQASQPKTEEG